MKNIYKIFILSFTLSFFTICSSFIEPKAIETNTEINAENIDTNNINNDVVEVFNHQQQTLYLTKSDIDLMAKLIYAESRGEPYEGKVAVASVVLNRVTSPKFPNSVKEVIYQPKAFSCVKNGTIVAYPDENCFNAVYDALRGNDPTNQALYFYNPSTATCSWMKGTEKIDITSIGNHIFFKC